MSNKQLILQTTKNLIGLKVRNVKIESENFLAIDFGDDISFGITVEGKTETIRRPAWRLLIQDNDWATDICKEHLRSLDLCHYIVPDEPTFDCTSLNRNTIDLISSKLKDQTLEEIKVYPSCKLTIFIFNNLQLEAVAIDLFENETIANWYLYTPEHKILCVKYCKAWLVNELTEGYRYKDEHK